VLDESRSFFRVHTGYFSNIPKCIKAEFIASWACSQSSVVSSSKRKENSRKRDKKCATEQAKSRCSNTFVTAMEGAIDLPRAPGEDPLKWLKEYDRVANFNRWDDMMCLANVYFSFLTELEERWYVNNEDT
ncbi:hypothetical protein TNCV_3736711, partial [Trichonephila clavipes]